LCASESAALDNRRAQRRRQLPLVSATLLAERRVGGQRQVVGHVLDALAVCPAGLGQDAVGLQPTVHDQAGDRAIPLLVAVERVFCKPRRLHLSPTATRATVASSPLTFSATRAAMCPSPRYSRSRRLCRGSRAATAVRRYSG